MCHQCNKNGPTMKKIVTEAHSQSTVCQNKYKLNILNRPRPKMQPEWTNNATRVDKQCNHNATKMQLK